MKDTTKSVSSPRLFELARRQKAYEFILGVEELGMGDLALNWTMLVDAAFVAISCHNYSVATDLIDQLEKLLSELHHLVPAEDGDPVDYVHAVYIALRQKEYTQAVYVLGQLRLSLYQY